MATILRQDQSLSKILSLSRIIPPSSKKKNFLETSGQIARSEIYKYPVYRYDPDLRMK